MSSLTTDYAVYAKILFFFILLPYQYFTHVSHVQLDSLITQAKFYTQHIINCESDAVMYYIICTVYNI